MGRVWSSWEQLTAVLAYVFLANHMGMSLSPSDISVCNASVSMNQTCFVTYLSTVTLRCPAEVGSPSTWSFKTKLVVYGPDYTITRATSASTGVYTCRGSEGTCYVQLNVLAPPALRLVSFCNTPLSSTCRSPQPLITVSSPVMNATVYYSGFGTMNVTWSKKSNLDGSYKPVQCSPPTCKLDTRLPYQQSIVYERKNPFQMDDVGVYMANVSNEYGSNTTLIILNVTCDPKNPPPLPVQARINTNFMSIKEGMTQNISCVAEMDSTTTVKLCFKSSEDNSSDCSSCQAFTTGSCSAILSKSHWKINSLRTFENGPCKPKRWIIATIENVQLSDAGKVSCYWSSPVYKNTLYMEHNVSVIPDIRPSSLPIPIISSSTAVTGAVGLISLFVVVSVIVGYLFRKQQTKSNFIVMEVIERGDVPVPFAADDAVTMDV